MVRDIFMREWNPKKQKQTKQNRLRETESKLMVAREEGDGGCRMGERDESKYSQ